MNISEENADVFGGPKDWAEALHSPLWKKGQLKQTVDPLARKRVAWVAETKIIGVQNKKVYGAKDLKLYGHH